MSVPLWKLSNVQVLGFACLGLAAGIWLKRRFPVLDRLTIPASIVGGLLLSVIALLMRDRVLNLEPDLALRDVLMIGFFTTIGMGASVRMLRAGGVQVGIFLLFCSVIAVVQNVVGAGLAQVLGLNPLIGVLAGSVALAGGPATALAFGQSFEQWGVSGAAAIGLASAMWGIVAGGLVGGPVSTGIIRRFVLQSAPVREDAPASVQAGPAALDRTRLMSTVILIGVAMGLGAFFTGAADPWLKQRGLALPAYIGAMLAASLLRNVDDATGWFGISQETVNAVGDVALNIFIVMALMTLQLWALVNLALPLVVILAVQAVVVWLTARYAVYYLMGRDYNSAVMCGGYVGFMLGTTANALANMGALTSKYGAAPRAYLVVPLVGAFLIDFTNALVITTFANFLR